MAKYKNINTIYLGKTICIQIDYIKNTGTIPVQDVFVQVTVPEGLLFTEARLPQGTYNPSTNIWTIGTLIPGQGVVGELCFTVTDECLSSFKFEFKADSLSACQACVNAATECLILQGQSCCEIDNCGFSKFGSETYDLTCPDPFPEEPTTPPANPIDEQYYIEFYQNCEIWWQYDAENEIWVVVNGITIGSGTISQVTNTIAGHLIATHSNVVGADVDINETVTTVTDVVAGHLIATHSSEDGTVTEIDETITTITNTVPGHLIGVHTNEEGTSTEIDETITELVEEIEGPFTYSDEGGTPTTVGHEISAGIINVDYNLSNQFTITFPFTFTNPPVVNITPANPSSGTYYVKIVSVTTTGFIATATYITPAPGMYSAYHWIAISQSGISISPTPSPTAFITPTPTPTVTPTRTQTLSVTVTPSVTETSSITPTPSETTTPTVTPTETPTVTPSETPTPTPSPA